MILSVALYASESWTLRKTDSRRIEAFDMWCWRKILKISYKDVSNDRVLARIGGKRALASKNKRTEIMDRSQSTTTRKLVHLCSRGQSHRKVTTRKEEMCVT